MQALKDRLLSEALEDLYAELTVRAFERQQLLAALVNGFRPNSRALDLALPSRLLEAAARIGRGPLELASPREQVEQVEAEPKELTATPEAEATTEPAVVSESSGNTEAGPPAEAAGLVERIRELRGREPPVAWKAIAEELAVTDYRLNQLREQYGL